MQTKYTHTNLVARNWRRLADFYQQVFECIPAPPERNLSGAWLERATGISGAQIQGMHLRLPGHGEQGPTLEIFQYNLTPERAQGQANTPGFAHIAFAVEDVPATARLVIQHGGSTVGELTEREIPGTGKITFQYVRDPEGNIVEIQKWG